VKVWRLVFKSITPAGVVCINHLHYQTDQDIGAGEPGASQILTRLDTELRTLYKAALAEEDTLTALELREEVRPPAVPSPGADVAVGQAGTLVTSTNDLPDGMCLIIAKKTGIPSRSARGYLALPSPRSSAHLSSSRLWASTYLSAAQALAAKLDDSYDLGSPNGSLHPVVYSRTRHLAGESTYTFAVTSALARDVPHWRRSRMTAP
jgi:hypothetical protein